MSSSNDRLLGSPYLLAQSAPPTPDQVAPLTPDICMDLSAWRSLLSNYRRLDDTITTRMNRAHALARRDANSSYADLSETECSAFFQELLGVWRGRERALSYCSAVANASLAKKRREVFGSERATIPDGRLDQDRASRDALYSEQVKVDQIAREKDIERIVRRRTLSVFLSRCRAHPSSFALEPRSGEDEVRLDLLKPQ